MSVLQLPVIKANKSVVSVCGRDSSDAAAESCVDAEIACWAKTPKVGASDRAAKAKKDRKQRILHQGPGFKAIGGCLRRPRAKLP